jgi:hypothetical protein
MENDISDITLGKPFSTCAEMTVSDSIAFFESIQKQIGFSFSEPQRPLAGGCRVLEVASRAEMAPGAREASGKPSNIENPTGLVLAQNEMIP